MISEMQESTEQVAGACCAKENRDDPKRQSAHIKKYLTFFM